jgi:hypothetical protein
VPDQARRRADQSLDAPHVDELGQVTP